MPYLLHFISQNCPFSPKAPHLPHLTTRWDEKAAEGREEEEVLAGGGGELVGREEGKVEVERGSFPKSHLTPPLASNYPKLFHLSLDG